MHVSNPDAVACGPALLTGWRLEFFGPSKRWHGSPASIAPSSSGHEREDCVAGVLWSIRDLAPLDRQEESYEAISVNVTRLLPSDHPGSVITCRTYQRERRPGYTVGLPSRTLKRVMITGAEEHALPHWFLEKLTRLRDNGDESPPQLSAV